MKNIKNLLFKIAIFAVVVMTTIVLIPNKSKAATTCIVRAPFDGTVIVNGKTLTDADMCDYGYMDGRIQRIAAEKYQVVCKYKDYRVTVGSLNEIVVYDANKIALTYTIKGVVLDYTSSSNKAFLDSVTETVKGAAIAYHNRVGGYGATTFGSYFLPNTDAYTRACNSDAGRKWGQYMKAPNINSVIVSEVFIYSPDIFSARVDIQASGSGVENYTIYFLFKNVNGKFYVTNFTYQD